jgi:molybdopterin converting factor small subunit
MSISITVFFVGHQRKITGIEEYTARFKYKPTLNILKNYLYWKFPGLEDNLGDLMVVNGVAEVEYHVLKDGDNVLFIPHIGGG